MKRIISLAAILVLFTLLVVTSRNIASAQDVEAPFQDPLVILLYIKPGGSGGCTSWADACELQTALAAASSGAEIWVQAGVYKPTAGTDRTLTFALKSGVAIYGGFVGTETKRNQRDWETNVTTLSGDIGAAGDNSDNSYHVVTGSGVDATAILDGFTITGGNANGGSYADFGGGMYNNAGSPTLTDITFSANSAAYGGGLFNHTSNPALNHITFAENYASQNGGGMYNYLSSPTLIHSIFYSNDASLNGGGMDNTGGSPMLTNITFSENTAADGGGLYNYESSPTLTDVTFSSNDASQDGGGAHNYAGNPTFTNITFSGNTAGQYGGGMYNDACSAALTEVNFTDNAAVARGGGIYNYSGSNGSLTNITVFGNSASFGGGIFNYVSSPTLVNVTFSGNIASQNGGGSYNYMGNPTLTNVTFSANAAPSGSGIYNDNSSPTIKNAILWGNSPDQLFNGISSTPAVSYSDIQGGCPSGTTCTQVINLDPQFTRSPLPGGDGTWGTTDDDYGDLRLQLASPAIDAGDNTAVPVGVITDLDGSPRFINVFCVPDTGYGTAPIVDMGAYETHPETIPPTVVSILRANPSPTNAASVNYTVTFSEAVTGVGASDFTLTLTGVTGATVSGVSGGPTTYTVAVSTGTGSGTLRLDVPGTASITDTVGNPLSGLPYTSGESYTIDKTAPTVVSILRASPNPTNAASVSYTVTFSEAVTGVGASDFSLTLSGITGATVSGVSGGPTTYTVAISTGTGSGTLKLDVPGTASIADAAGNSLSGLPYTGGELYTIDKTAPMVVSILRADPSPTNADSVDYTVVFSEAVTGVGVSDFTLTLTGIIDAHVTGVSGGPTIYTVTIDTGRRSGTLRLDVPTAASITDAVGNLLSGLPYTGGESYTIDRDEPTVVSILRADPSPTNADSVEYTVTFSEAVSGVGASDFSLTLSGITGATVTGVSGGPTTYTAAISTGTGNGTLRLDVPTTASITDVAGNSLNDLPYTGGQSYTIDKTAPTVVSILRADPSPTNADSVDYTVTFSEAVTGAGMSDFTLTLSEVTGASITGVSGGPTTYTVAVSTGTGDGTLRLDVSDTASIEDVASNLLSGLPYTGGESYTIDKTAPTAVSILRANPSPTNADSVEYTVTFSEAVTGVGASDFTLTLSGITGASVTGVSGGPTTYTAAVSTGTGNGTLRLDVPITASITDVAGNSLNDLPYTDGELYTIDKTAPTVVSILRADPSPTNAASVEYTVTFSEAVTGVGMSDFTLTLSGVAGASITGVSGGPTIYTVAVATGTGSGALRLDVPGTASITDGVGNSLSGLPYTGGESYTIDKTAPTVVSILRADPNPTNATSVHFIVTFSENVTGVDAVDFHVFTTGTLSGSSVTNVSSTGTAYIVTVSVGTGSGSLRLDIPGLALIDDMVGNRLSGLPYESGEAYSILWKIFLPSLRKATP
jgi:hypothetical protein